MSSYARWVEEERKRRQRESGRPTGERFDMRVPFKTLDTESRFYYDAKNDTVVVEFIVEGRFFTDTRMPMYKLIVDGWISREDAEAVRRIRGAYR